MAHNPYHCMYTAYCEEDPVALISSHLDGLLLGTNKEALRPITMMLTQRFSVLKSEDPPFFHCVLQIAGNAKDEITSTKSTYLQRL